MVRIFNEGYAGSALTFVNYNYELPFFCDGVLPLMRQAGLRVVWVPCVNPAPASRQRPFQTGQPGRRPAPSR